MIAASPYSLKLPKVNPTAENYLALVSLITSQQNYYSDPDRITKHYLINRIALLPSRPEPVIVTICLWEQSMFSKAFSEILE